jgi:hypothetical protein
MTTDKPMDPATLFVTRLYPSARGAGSQIRVASLVRMLAARGPVRLVIVNVGHRPLEPRDRDLEAACESILCLRVDEEKNTNPPAQRSPEGAPGTERMESIACGRDEIASQLVRYAQTHALERLFVSQMESLSLIADCLDAFPWRVFDLDELTSRRDAQIASLDGGSDPAAAGRIRIDKILEKKLLPRFRHVFVSSALETRWVREQNLGVDAHELPNIRPVPAAARAPLLSEANEILFVGLLSYFPNRDAIRWFCHAWFFPVIRPISRLFTRARRWRSCPCGREVARASRFSRPSATAGPSLPPPSARRGSPSRTAKTSCWPTTPPTSLLPAAQF